MALEPSDKYTNSALRIGDKDPYPQRVVGEFIGTVVSNDWVNAEYKHVVLKIHEHALKAYAGQMFHLLCPSPDGAEVWMRRPMSVYRVDKARSQVEFLYKSEGRGTRGMATLAPGDDFNIAADNGVGVTAILSARNADVVMSKELFEGLGAKTITVVDSDGSSAVENVEKILEDLIAMGKADAFFTCGSNRLLKLMQRLGKKHDIPGQVAMEQIMVCGFGACYVCMRTFLVDGQRVLRRVCRDGPVFNMQEAVGW